MAHPVLADHHLLTKLRVSVDHRGWKDMTAPAMEERRRLGRKVVAMLAAAHRSWQCFRPVPSGERMDAVVVVRPRRGCW